MRMPSGQGVRLAFRFVPHQHAPGHFENHGRTTANGFDQCGLFLSFLLVDGVDGREEIGGIKRSLQNWNIIVVVVIIAV